MSLRPVVLAILVMSSTARAEDAPQSLRWEGSAGFGYYSMPLREERLSGGGILLEIGARLRAFGLAAEYRWLGVTWEGTPSADGVVHRFGLTARYHLDLCCGREAGMIALVFDAGVGLDLIEWHDGGELARRNVEVGIALRAGMRKFAFKPRFSVILAPREASYDMAPACAGPCDHATSPTRWDLGLMFTQTFVFGN